MRTGEAHHVTAGPRARARRAARWHGQPHRGSATM